MFGLFYTDEFRRDYKSLSRDEQQSIKRALERLTENPRHPGLRAKKMQGREHVWEARASRVLRITFVFDNRDTIILRTCGHHDQALR